MEKEETARMKHAGEMAYGLENETNFFNRTYWEKPEEEVERT